MAGSVLGKIAGGVVGGLIGGKGDKKAARQMEQAALAAQARVEPFTRPPFSVQTVLGNTAGNRFHLSQSGNEAINNLTAANRQLFQGIRGFDRGAFTDRFFDAIDRLESRREGQALNSFESRLFNRQGVNTGTQRQIADFMRDIEDARLRRSLQTELTAEGVFSNRLKDAFSGVDALRGLQGSQLAQFDRSFYGSRLTEPVVLPSNQGLLAAGGIRAQSTQDFFGNLGGAVGGAVGAGIPWALGGGGFGGGGGGGFTANPFTNIANPINPQFASLGF
jgi:hypothetical protein